MALIEIKNKKTGEVVQSFSTDEFAVKRSSHKLRTRLIRKLTDSEFDALVDEIIGGGRGGKRIDAARLVLTEHTTSTEAALRYGISVPGVSDLVKHIERVFINKQEAFSKGLHDRSVKPAAAPSDDLEDLFE